VSRGVTRRGRRLDGEDGVLAEGSLVVGDGGGGLIVTLQADEGVDAGRANAGFGGVAVIQAL